MYSVAVDILELEAAAAAAEVLQAALDEVDNDQLSKGSAVNELLLAGIKVADQLVDLTKQLKAAKREIHSLKSGNGQAAAEMHPPDAELLQSLERFARRTESLADRLEELLTEEDEEPREAL